MVDFENLEQVVTPMGPAVLDSVSWLKQININYLVGACTPKCFSSISIGRKTANLKG